MNHTSLAKPEEILNFWFVEIDKKLWFKKDDNFDQLLRDRYLGLFIAATNNELYNWRVTIEGRLAEIIVLDQFSRNIFRDQAEAFANDNLALCLAQETVAQGLDIDLELSQRAFLYMPYMHSESLLIHEKAQALFNVPGLEDNYRFEQRHKEIIEQFGRYPHRNRILDRISTPDEIEFLSKPGSSF